MKHNKQQGFTLLELMISLTVGLLLIAGTVTMMGNSSTALKRHEINADMTSAIRLASNLIQHDVQSAGYFGRTRYPGDITGRLNDTNPLPNIGGDCDTGFYADIQRYVYASNDINPFASSCLQNVGYLAGTDVLVVKYAKEDANLTAATPVGALDADTLYVYSNPTGGELFRGNNPPALNPTPYAGAFAPNIQKRFYEVLTHVYFIGNPPDDDLDANALYRLEMDLGSGTPFTPQLISTDIVNLQVRFGVENCTVGSIGGSTACQGIVDDYVDGDALELSGTVPSYEAVIKIRTVSVAFTALSDRIQGADAMTTRTHNLRGMNITASNAALFQGTTFHVRNSENIFSGN